MIFGGFPFGAAPFGAGPEWPMSVGNSAAIAEFVIHARALDPRIVMLEEMTRGAVHAVKINAWHKATSTEVTLYFSDREFVTQADDEVGNVRFVGRLATALAFSRSMIRQQGYGGLVRGEGSIVIHNEDGRYDALRDEYAFDGRDVEVRVGRVGDYFLDMMTVWTGKVFDTVGADQIEFKINDRVSELDVPLVTQTFGGTGGLDGTDDLFMKRCPFAIGDVVNVSPVLVWPQKNIYMVNSPAWGSLDYLPYGYVNVSVNGADLLHAGAFTSVSDPGFVNFTSDDPPYVPPAGYKTVGIDLHSGRIFVRLGSVPDNQVVTASIVLERDIGNIAPGNLTTKAVAIGDVVFLSGQSWPGDFEVRAFRRHVAQQPYATGLWYDQNSSATVAEAADRLCGEATFFGATGEGQYTVGVMSDDMGSPVIHLNDTNILDIDIERLPNGLSPPVWRWKMGWMRNWTDMRGRIAGSVDDIRRGFLSEEIRVAGYQWPPLKTAHPLAQERESLDDMFVGDYGSGGAGYLDAVDEARRLYDLYNSGRQVYRIVTTKLGLLARFGSTVHVTHRRYGLSGGKPMIVVADSYDSAATRGTYRGLVTLICFG